VPARLLLDEMFPRAMAEQLNAKGHDVRAVVADPEFAGLSDEDVLIGATEAGRALATANIKDFMPLDARYRASGRPHAGLVMVSSKTFPQSRSSVIAVAGALDALLAAHGIQPGGVVFLARSPSAGSGPVAGLRVLAPVDKATWRRRGQAVTTGACSSATHSSGFSDELSVTSRACPSNR
jgi:Domain of unknown function (DUF5615)